MNTISFRVQAYLNYLTKRRTIQYIHSPFLFSLMQNVFDDSAQKRPPIFNEIEKQRKILMGNKEMIHFKDFGAGADKDGENKEIEIAAIAKRSLKQAKYARFLYRLIQFTKSTCTVELGTSLGITSLYLAAGAGPMAKVYSVEADKTVKKIAQKNWIQFPGIGHIDCYLFDLNEKWSLLVNEIGKIDFLFIDANHRKEAMMRYFFQGLPGLHEKSVVVLDDIHWDEETLEAWNILKARKEVTLSFDIFQMGILFFDKNLSKEDFTLKY